MNELLDSRTIDVTTASSTEITILADFFAVIISPGVPPYPGIKIQFVVGHDGEQTKPIEFSQSFQMNFKKGVTVRKIKLSWPALSGRRLTVIWSNSILEFLRLL